MSGQEVKSSFDRFGDDLSELLLSFLSTEDLFRFECLSKQCRRLVFNKLTELSLIEFIGVDSDYAIDCTLLDNAMRKLLNVRHIDLGFQLSNSEEVIKSIVKYCNKLVSFKGDFSSVSSETIQEFIQKYGNSLKRLEFKSDCNRNKELLKWCSNLKCLHIGNPNFEDLSLLFDDNEVIVKNLESVSLRYSVEDTQRIGLFIEQNKDSLKSVTIRFYGNELIEQSFSELFHSLSKLTKIRCFSLTCFGLPFEDSLVSNIEMLGNCCQNLEKIQIIISKNSSIDFKVFESFKSFKQLKQIDYEMKGSTEVENTSVLRSDCLKYCRNLTHLKIKTNFDSIDDHFIQDLDKNLPKLIVLELNLRQISDTTIKFLSKLSNLQTLCLFSRGAEEAISESVAVELIKTSNRLKNVVIGDQ